MQLRGQGHCVPHDSCITVQQLRAPGRVVARVDNDAHRRRRHAAAAFSPQLEHSLACWQQLLEAPAAPCAETSAARWAAATAAAAEVGAARSSLQLACLPCYPHGHLLAPVATAAASHRGRTAHTCRRRCRRPVLAA